MIFLRCDFLSSQITIVAGVWYPEKRGEGRKCANFSRCCSAQSRLFHLRLRRVRRLVLALECRARGGERAGRAEDREAGAREDGLKIRLRRYRTNVSFRGIVE